MAATGKAIFIQSGIIQQLVAADTLYLNNIDVISGGSTALSIGNTLATSVGIASAGSACTSIDIGTASSITTASVATNATTASFATNSTTANIATGAGVTTLNIGTGATTGAVNIGTALTTGSVAIGTGMTAGGAINIGGVTPGISSGADIYLNANVSIAGVLTELGTSSFRDMVTFKGPVTFGLASTTTVAAGSNAKTLPIAGGVIAVASTDGFASASNIVVEATPTTAAGGSQTLPLATINVTSTLGFSSSGTIYADVGGTFQAVTYLGRTGTSFTGCTGGTGLITGVVASGNSADAVPTTVAYTGITPTTFTGCTGGTGMLLTGAAIREPVGIDAVSFATQTRVMTDTYWGVSGAQIGGGSRDAADPGAGLAFIVKGGTGLGDTGYGGNLTLVAGTGGDSTGADVGGAGGTVYVMGGTGGSGSLTETTIDASEVGGWAGGGTVIVASTADFSESGIVVIPVVTAGAIEVTYTSKNIDGLTLEDCIYSYADTISAGSSTTLDSSMNTLSLPQATINVASTTGFPTIGKIAVTTSLGVEMVTYGGKTGSSFTSCYGGTGTMSTGGAVTQNAYLKQANTTIGAGVLLPAEDPPTSGTITVSDTTGFDPAGGTIYFDTVADGTQTVTYTGLTPTTFTGCTGGTGESVAGPCMSATPDPLATSILSGTLSGDPTTISILTSSTADFPSVGSVLIPTTTGTTMMKYSSKNADGVTFDGCYRGGGTIAAGTITLTTDPPGGAGGDVRVLGGDAGFCPGGESLVGGSVLIKPGAGVNGGNAGTISIDPLDATGRILFGNTASSNFALYADNNVTQYPGLRWSGTAWQVRDNGVGSWTNIATSTSVTPVEAGTAKYQHLYWDAGAGEWKHDDGSMMLPKGADRTIAIEALTVAGSGNALNLKPNDGFADGDFGGGVYVNAGTGGASTGTGAGGGGDCVVTGGTGGTQTGTELSGTGGRAALVGGDGGAVGGKGNYQGDGGDAEVFGGAGGSGGGSVTIAGGAGTTPTTGTGGNVTIRGGNGAGEVNKGDVLIGISNTHLIQVGNNSSGRPLVAITNDGGVEADGIIEFTQAVAFGTIGIDACNVNFLGNVNSRVTSNVTFLASSGGYTIGVDNSTADAGGGLTVQSGAGDGAAADGGAINITTGDSGTTGAGGDVNITAGDGQGATYYGGSVILQAGEAGSTADSGAGQVNIYGGDNNYSGLTGTTGGAVTIVAGSSTAGDHNGGTVDIKAGAGFGTGTSGIIKLGDGNTSTVQFGGSGGSTTIDFLGNASNRIVSDLVFSDANRSILIIDSGTPRTLTIHSSHSTTGGVAGGATTISGGNGQTTGAGGLLTLTGGDSGAGGTAGSVVINAGQATGGTTGNVTIGGTAVGNRATLVNLGNRTDVSEYGAIAIPATGAITFTEDLTFRGFSRGGATHVIQVDQSPQGNYGDNLNIYAGKAPANVTTTLASSMNGLTLPQATIEVASFVGFISAGKIRVNTTTGYQLVTYTGTAAAPPRFTGCTGGDGVGTMSTGDTVNSAVEGGGIRIDAGAKDPVGTAHGYVMIGTSYGSSDHQTEAVIVGTLAGGGAPFVVMNSSTSTYYTRPAILLGWNGLYYDDTGGSGGTTQLVIGKTSDTKFTIYANKTNTYQAGIRYNDGTGNWEVRSTTVDWSVLSAGGSVLPTGTNYYVLQWIGGNPSWQPGLTLPDGAGRSISIMGTTGTDTAQTLTIHGSNALTGNNVGGDVSILGGVSQGSGTGGNVTIASGVTVTGVTGGVYIYAEEPTGAGTFGLVEIGNKTAGVADHSAIEVDDIFSGGTDPSGILYLGHWTGGKSPYLAPVVAVGRSADGGLTYLDLGGGTGDYGSAQIDGNIFIRPSAGGSGVTYAGVEPNLAGIGDGLNVYSGAGATNNTGGNLDLTAGAYGGSASTIVAFTNALRTAYEAHRVIVTGAPAIHGLADAVNTVGAAATDLATALTLLNDIKVKYNLHHVYTTGGVHAGAGDTNTVTAANATDLATAIVLAEDIKAMYNAHRVNVTSVHGSADGTNPANAGMDGSVKIGSGTTSYVLLGTDTNGWHMDVAANMFEYRGTGNIRLPGQFWIGATQTSANVTATNLNTLTGGSDASALHYHASAGSSTISTTCGEAVTKGMVVGIKDSTGAKTFKTVTNSAGSTPHFVLGLSNTTTTSSGDTLVVVTSGEVTIGAGDEAAVWDSAPIAADVGKLVWALDSASAGKLTLTPPTTTAYYKTKVGILTFAGSGSKVAVQIGDPMLL